MILAALREPNLQADLALQEAHMRGRQAGRLLLSASLNPHPDYTDESGEWLSGWQSAINEHMRGRI